MVGPEHHGRGTCGHRAHPRSRHRGFRHPNLAGGHAASDFRARLQAGPGDPFRRGQAVQLPGRHHPAGHHGGQHAHPGQGPRQGRCQHGSEARRTGLRHERLRQQAGPELGAYRPAQRQRQPDLRAVPRLGGPVHPVRLRSQRGRQRRVGCHQGRAARRGLVELRGRHPSGHHLQAA